MWVSIIINVFRLGINQKAFVIYIVVQISLTFLHILALWVCFKIIKLLLILTYQNKAITKIWKNKNGKNRVTTSPGRSSSHFCNVATLAASSLPAATAFCWKSSTSWKESNVLKTGIWWRKIKYRGKLKIFQIPSRKLLDVYLLFKDKKLFSIAIALTIMIQLIRTAVSPQQKLDWFLPACQIRWQTRPVREPFSWNKTIIVDPCLKKEKMRWQQWHIQQYGKVTCKPFGRRANPPWKRFPKEQTASPKDLSAFLKNKIKNKRHLGKLIFVLQQ